jgi:hypothetical protein
MPDQNPTPSAAERGDALERETLYLMTEPDGQPIWSVDDIGREAETNEPMVPVRGLLRAGLIYQTSDGFVFATRAGWRIVEIVGQVA